MFTSWCYVTDKICGNIKYLPLPPPFEQYLLLKSSDCNLCSWMSVVKCDNWKKMVTICQLGAFFTLSGHYGLFVDNEIKGTTIADTLICLLTVPLTEQTLINLSMINRFLPN